LSKPGDGRIEDVVGSGNHANMVFLVGADLERSSWPFI